MGEFSNAVQAEEWFAMRATYRREFQAQRQLEASGIRSYIPMREEDRIEGGRRRKVKVPAVHNLIFVRTDKDTLQSFKGRVPYLQYMMGRSEGGVLRPIVIPDKSMDDFIRVTESCGDGVEYLRIGDRAFKAGMRVRVRGGVLDGVEGILVKEGKRNDRKLVVSLNGILSVATTSVYADTVEVLGQDDK